MLVRTLSGSQHRPVARVLSWEHSGRHHRNHSKRTTCNKIEEDEEERKIIKVGSKLSRKIRIRVSGKLFETTEVTLSAFPRTLLGRRSDRDRFYDKTRGEYIFNRCFYSFDAILFYYQSRGILSRPAYVKRSKFLEELTFFKINVFLDIRHRRETKFVETEKNKHRKPSSRARELVWRIMCFKNNPRYRNSSYMFYIVMVVFSVVTICLEPSVKPKRMWFLFELFLFVLFTCEYAIRVFIANETKQYMMSPLGLLDLFSMLSSFVYITVHLTRDTVGTIPIIKLSQVVRVLKYARVSRGVQEFFHVLWACREQVSLFIGTALVSCFLAATVIHLAEQNADKSKPENNVTFFNWVWYSIITATGVGYGDYYPKTGAGKLVGGILSVIGVLIFCLPATQLVYKFVDLYYLPDVLGTNSDGRRKLLIAAVREKFLEDMEACAS